MINDTDTESNIAEQERRNIEDLGSVETKNPRGNIHCLNIIGQVEGHMVLPPQNKTTKYEHVLPQLIAIEENPEIDGLMVLLNTVGGDVEAGLAIAEMVAGMSKPTVSLVLGGRQVWLAAIASGWPPDRTRPPAGPRRWRRWCPYHRRAARYPPRLPPAWARAAAATGHCAGRCGPSPFCVHNPQALRAAPAPGSRTDRAQAAAAGQA